MANVVSNRPLALKCRLLLSVVVLGYLVSSYLPTGAADCTLDCDIQTCVGYSTNFPFPHDAFFYYDVAAAFTMRTDSPQGGEPIDSFNNQYKLSDGGYWCPNNAGDTIKSDYCMPYGDWLPKKTGQDCGAK